MNVLEIKHDLLQLLVDTNDERLLENVRQYFKSLLMDPSTLETMEVQKGAMIETGIQQIENGQVMSHEEAMRKIKDRFKHFKK